MKKRNICGIFATVFAIATVISLASCSQDDEYYYDSEMFTRAEGMVLDGEGNLWGEDILVFDKSLEKVEFNPINSPEDFCASSERSDVTVTVKYNKGNQNIPNDVTYKSHDNSSLANVGVLQKEVLFQPYVNRLFVKVKFKAQMILTGGEDNDTVFFLSEVKSVSVPLNNNQ